MEIREKQFLNLPWIYFDCRNLIIREYVRYLFWEKDEGKEKDLQNTYEDSS